MLTVFIGTKAQYVKMAPLLHLLDDNKVDYRLIDSGQHAQLAVDFRAELNIRDPDLHLGTTRDVNSIPHALLWAAKLALLLLSRSRLRKQVFTNSPTICLVHGDTPTTLISALMARRAGIPVAHVEAGLRTFRWFHPFPEEIIRVFVDRMSDLLFAPNAIAAQNLRNSRVKGRIVEQDANTVADTVATHFSVQQVPPTPKGVVVTMHRVENLQKRSRVEAMVDLLVSISPGTTVTWYLHGPTERALSTKHRQRLADAGINLTSLVSHGDFLDALAASSYVITDGGSIQEECALLGVPTLLWRDRTDREDGVDENIVISHYDPKIVSDFLSDPQAYRRHRTFPASNPSQQILDELQPWLS